MIADYECPRCGLGMGLKDSYDGGWELRCVSRLCGFYRLIAVSTLVKDGIGYLISSEFPGWSFSRQLLGTLEQLVGNEADRWFRAIAWQGSLPRGRDVRFSGELSVWDGGCWVRSDRSGGSVWVDPVTRRASFRYRLPLRGQVMMETLRRAVSTLISQVVWGPAAPGTGRPRFGLWERVRMIEPERVPESYNRKVYRSLFYRSGEDLTVVGWSAPGGGGQVHYLVGKGRTAYAEDCLELVQ
jgi:hypothetical protein